MAIIDISQPIRSGIPTWPGDTAFRAERTWQLGPECPVNVSRIEMSTHTGTHADAPFHYRGDGLPIADVALDSYLGPCVVVDVSAAQGSVGLADLSEAAVTAPRVLLRLFREMPVGWPNFIGIDPALIDRLATLGVRLLGVDTPSLDPEKSKEMAAHRAIDKHGMAILEGLLLDGVVPGPYDLVALPLPFTGLDASPIRAVQTQPLRSPTRAGAASRSGHEPRAL